MAGGKRHQLLGPCLMHDSNDGRRRAGISGAM